MQKHKCAKCGRNDVRLYRYYGSFLREDEIFCRSDAPAGEIDMQYLVPLCEDEDGNVWGYTAVDEAAMKRFKALPEG